MFNDPYEFPITIGAREELKYLLSIAEAEAGSESDGDLGWTMTRDSLSRALDEDHPGVILISDHIQAAHVVCEIHNAISILNWEEPLLARDLGDIAQRLESCFKLPAQDGISPNFQDT